MVVGASVNQERTLLGTAQLGYNPIFLESFNSINECMVND